MWDGGTSKIAEHAAFIQSECMMGREVIILDVSGAGALLPNTLTEGGVASYPMFGFYGTLHKLAIDFIWMDDSLPALRTYDVIRAVDALHDGDWANVDTSDIKLYLSGLYGMYGYLAAALDGRITELEAADNTFDSIETWVSTKIYDTLDIYSIVFPGILKYGDVMDFLDYAQLPPVTPSPTLVSAATSAKDFVSIVETSKNSRVWALTFNVTMTYSDGRVEVAQYTVYLNGNNANLDGAYVFGEGHGLAGYTLKFDIKGNGSNIKAFMLK